MDFPRISLLVLLTLHKLCTASSLPFESQHANFYQIKDDPSVLNPTRPSVVDNRPGVFDMTARSALDIIDKIHRQEEDCNQMIATRGIKLLNIRYQNTEYMQLAEIAIKTANFISDLLPTGTTSSLNTSDDLSVVATNVELLYSLVRANVESEKLIFGSAVMFDKYIFPNKTGNYTYFAPYAYRNLHSPFIKVKDLSTTWSYIHEAFIAFVKSKTINRPFPVRTTYYIPRYNMSSDSPPVKTNHTFVEFIDGIWSRPYYECTTSRAWQITFTAPILGNWKKDLPIKYLGISTIDIELTNVDINQCDLSDAYNFQFEIFAGTHRCKNETTMCVPLHGLGFRAGSYKCECRPGFYYPHSFSGTNYFNGTVIEYAAMNNNSNYYTDASSYQCRRCRPGCSTCVNNAPCIVTYNWPLRQSLLAFTVLTIILAFGVLGFILYFRQIKVVKSASPHFLCIIIAGTTLMYCEILVWYPVSIDILCIVRVWFRHIGFGLAYTSLLLKTWRISVIFRVKSAQKIKLNDLNLLQRLLPIMAVYMVYLLAWSLAGPSHVIVKKDADGLKFRECSVDWWDHAILIFEILFLLWGIRLCYNVRKAPSAFNESKFISWSIYNMTVVTIFLKVTRLFISSLAGPDMNFMLEFFRVQLTVTLLLSLVFAPKIIRVLKGRGDIFDTSGRIASAKGRALNLKAGDAAGGTSMEGSVNLTQENEDLKEEIKKLYSQFQMIKTANMEAGNRHLNRSTSLLFGSDSCVAITGNDAVERVTNLSNKERKPQRMSPSAELASDYV